MDTSESNVDTTLGNDEENGVAKMEVVEETENRYSRGRKLENETGKNAFALTGELFQRVYKISPPPEYQFDEVFDAANQKGFVAKMLFNGQTFASPPCSNKKVAKLDCARQVLEVLIGEEEREKMGDPTPPMIFQREDTWAEMLRQHTYALFGSLSQQNPIAVGTEKVIASIFMMDKDSSSVKCISLATGNKCIRRQNIGFHGKALIDCHAEILVKRGLRRFLYAQINAFTWDSENSIFEKKQAREKLSLCDRFSFHLFINTAPCGDGRLYTLEDTENPEECSEHLDRNKGRLRFKIEDGMGKISDSKLLGQDFDLERFRATRELYWGISLSRSTSLQSLFRISIRLESRARAPKGSPYRLNHPSCLSCQTPYSITPNTGIATQKVSINWNLVDKTLESLNTFTGKLLTGEVSRLSASSFFQLFASATQALTGKGIPDDVTYLQVKAGNTSYADCKKRLLNFFAEKNLGEWQTKPIEFSMFSMKELEK
ncbi:unnamed protein product, partial [Mesorhabditis belari]|uniref:A to I editase domain-containing protein n=1 Tax=Mesorhabditis belari TaxID=2138241 RepID=A0AAF3F144_9BILA